MGKGTKRTGPNGKRNKKNRSICANVPKISERKKKV